jgi:DNA-directed RNA polymerase subunit RPC12/RpoP
MKSLIKKIYKCSRCGVIFDSEYREKGSITHENECCDYNLIVYINNILNKQEKTESFSEIEVKNLKVKKDILNCRKLWFDQYYLDPIFFQKILRNCDNFNKKIIEEIYKNLCKRIENGY